MAKLFFTCKLLSDVIINQNSGTKTRQTSLDFIPGNSFLGIAAANLYNNPEKNNIVIFHSGKVRFGDAHPLYNGIRTLKIPAILYHKKGRDLPDDGAFILYKWSSNNGEQPKQCRDGFYAFKNSKATLVKTEKSVAIKSAYDSERRRSKDEAMYSYEALRRGLELAFEVDFDSDAESLMEDVKNALVGIKHIGHSKTAQYGLAEIKSSNWEEIPSATPSASGIEGNNIATVYADGRLIFFNQLGMSSFMPSAQDLGFMNGAEIDWDKTQIRTFQYAPWNAKRNNPDTDRCGVEKGSVFVVRLNGTKSPDVSQYVGQYRNEGFGKIIYNPSFLNSRENGMSELIFNEGKKVDNLLNATGIGTKLTNTLLLEKIEAQIKIDFKDNQFKNSYKIINDFVKNDGKMFIDSNEHFASQWGYIRTLADMSPDIKSFRKDVNSFLNHGVAKEKWEYKKLLLDNFINTVEEKYSESWKDIMVNLAAEMAKKCKQ